MTYSNTHCGLAACATVRYDNAMTMTQHEYYIRQPADTESHGPFTLEQLSDLAKTGGLNANTLYFDANTDQWRPIAEAPELAALLPADVRAQTAAALSAAASASATASASAPAASLAPKLLVALLAASALALLFPAFLADDKSASVFEKLQIYPYLWLGALDLILALCCFAFGARFFPVIRIRAGLGIGFLGALFWLQANIGALVAALLVAVCLWLATTLGSARALAANAIAGLAALVMLAYCVLR